jgi:ABC-2 type transport system permease protein
MVAQFLGLKLRVTAGAFRRRPWQVVGLVLALLYGAFVTFVVVVALIGSRFFGEPDVVRNVVIVAGALVTLGFIVAPLILGTDDSLDPRAFALFGISNSRLATGLVIAALIGVPSIVLTLCSLATIVTWSRTVGSTLLAILCAVVAILTCVLAARVSTSIAAFLLSTRRAREFSGVIGLLLLVMASPLILFLVSIDWGRDGMSVLRVLADIASWTPLGAVWAAPADASLGLWGQAVLKVLIALATLGLLWLAWRALVATMLVTPGREVQGKTYAGLGWFGRLPANPAGVIAARSITYWGRDARYWVSLLMIPLVPVLIVVALSVVGVVPPHYIALLPLPAMCLFLGWTIHNDVAYDGTAIWLHMASGTRGYSDRIGRIVPVLLMGIPLVAVGSIVTVWAYGDWAVLPAVIGVNTSVLLSGIGISSFTSAMFPYPAPKPGDSPFAQPQTTGATSAFVQALSFFAILTLSAPAIVLTVLGILLGQSWFSLTLIIGVSIGVVVLAAGVAAGSAVFDRRGPEIVAFATRAD